MFHVLNKGDNEYLVFDDTDGTFEYTSILSVKTVQAKGFPIRFALDTGDILYHIFKSKDLDCKEEKDDRYVKYKFLFQFFDLLKADIPDYCCIEHWHVDYRSWLVNLFIVNNRGNVDFYWLGYCKSSKLYCSGKYLNIISNIKYGITDQRKQGYYTLSVDVFKDGYFDIVYSDNTKKYKTWVDRLYGRFKLRQSGGKLHVLRIETIRILNSAGSNSLTCNESDNSFRHIPQLQLKALQASGLHMRWSSFGERDFISEIRSCNNYLIRDDDWQTRLPFVLDFLKFSGCEHPENWSHCFYDLYNGFDTIIFVVHGSSTDLVFLSQCVETGVHYFDLLRNVFENNPDKSYVNLDFRVANTNKLRFSCLCDKLEDRQSVTVELLTDDNKFKVRLME